MKSNPARNPNKIRLSLTVDERTWKRFSQMSRIHKITVSVAINHAFWLFTIAKTIKRPIYKREKKLINRTIICDSTDTRHMRAKKAHFGLTWDELMETVLFYITDNIKHLDAFCDSVKKEKKNG